ncbi:MAG TPA: signal peptidase II [Candidatus Limnocylindria bacterium]|nr:signal peptidase II [Candidatus Limnocylindria bacterium]
MRDSRWRMAVLVALFVFVLDRATKVLVERTMTLEQTIDVLPFFALTYVRNPGAAFGLFRNLPEPLRLPLLLGVTAVAFVVLLAYLRETPPERRWIVVALGGVLGGALGNLYCRVRYGEVIDFFHLHWRGWSWPMFNVADSAITVGVIALLVSSFVDARRTARSTSEPAR